MQFGFKPRVAAAATCPISRSVSRGGEGKKEEEEEEEKELEVVFA